MTRVQKWCLAWYKVKQEQQKKDDHLAEWYKVLSKDLLFMLKTDLYLKMYPVEQTEDGEVIETEEWEEDDLEGLEKFLATLDRKKTIRADEVT